MYPEVRGIFGRRPDWPHAPIHRLGDAGSYFITAATYLKKRLLDETRRDRLIELTENLAPMHGLWLQAWVVLSNHYHIIVAAARNADIPAFARKLHSISSRAFNLEDKTPGRQVWFQYWDTHLTHQRSYLARLNYIHQNPVHHGLVQNAENYRWSSMRRLEEQAGRAFAESVKRFKIDRLKVPEFDV